MAAPVTKDELRDEIKRLEDESNDLVDQWKGRRFDEETHARFNVLQDERKDKLETLKEIERREEIITGYAENENATQAGAEFHVRRANTPTGEDIYDLSNIRRVWGDPSVEREELRDHALRAIEGAKFPHLYGTTPEDAQAHLERQLGAADTTGDGSVARHILATGSREYKDMFAKAIHGLDRVQLNDRERSILNRAMSLTGASGGVAVPYVLDPTLLPSYNGAVNAFRNLADVRTITVDEWRGVTSGGITAAYQAEAAATTDLSPTLASVSISTEMARVMIPYSIEIGMDWSSFASDMGSEIQNSKDVLEATKFATGTGTNEPFGVVTGATTVYTSSDSAAIYVADIYGAHDALGPLYRSRAAWAMANGTLSRIRQLDTAGGSNMLTPSLQVRSAANVGSTSAPDMQDSRANVDLFGKPVHEASGVATFADNALIAVFGAFDPYFKIIERVGLVVENVPHMFDATTGFPTGQRGLFAYWRNGSKVIHANAFRTLRVA